MKIRNYRQSDAEPIADLFREAVHSLSSEYYSRRQRQAWAPIPPDYNHWRQRLRQSRPLVATIDGQVAGFIELEASGHIDCLYVRPSYQRRGVARRLAERVISLAAERGLALLWVEASIVARPLFAALGFQQYRSNRVLRSGEVLVNYSMRRAVGPQSAATFEAT